MEPFAQQIIRLSRIHHVQVSIPIGSEDQARAFYCGILGLQEIPKPETLTLRGGFWLGIADQAIHFGVEDFPERSRSRQHVALETDDLAAVRSRLQECGISILECIPIPGFDRLELRDPFGNRLEILQAQAETDSPMDRPGAAGTTATMTDRQGM